MKLDRAQKRARLGEHLPGFPGYDVLNYREMDRQFRRLLAGEVEKVRDRLARLLAGGVPPPLHAPVAAALRETVALRDRLLPSSTAEDGDGPPDEERVLDLDLALLDRVAALFSPLDWMEAAVGGAELQAPLNLLREGVRAAADLFEQRARLLAKPSGT
jgi:hypothetical protein